MKDLMLHTLNNLKQRWCLTLTHTHTKRFTTERKIIEPLGVKHFW